MTTLNVRLEPAEGRVKEYKVVYVPAAGGAESMVGLVGQPSASCRPRYSPACLNTSVTFKSVSRLKSNMSSNTDVCKGSTDMTHCTSPSCFRHVCSFLWKYVHARTRFYELFHSSFDLANSALTSPLQPVSITGLESSLGVKGSWRSWLFYKTLQNSSCHCDRSASLELHARLSAFCLVWKQLICVMCR